MTRVDHLRQDYERGAFSRSDLESRPYDQFESWLKAALDSEEAEPTAMTLATVDSEGVPSARIVLLKGHSERGLVFYTNYRSSKARALTQTRRAALCFLWKSLERQVRVEGSVERATAEESDAYFVSRPRGSQIGAWASPQSEGVESREALEVRVREVEERFPEGAPIVRPDFWGGFRVLPERWEFWQGRKSRLHDRFEYRADGDGAWSVRRLAP